MEYSQWEWGYEGAGTQGGSQEQVDVGKGGRELLLESCAHSPYLIRPCLPSRSREPADPAPRGLQALPSALELNLGVS